MTSLRLFLLAFVCGLALGGAVVSSIHVDRVERQIARLTTLIDPP